MRKLLLLLALTSMLWAKYTNCEFQNKNYTDICKKVVKNGVSYEYANKFLLSYFKTQKFDEVSWKYLQPRHIKTHKKNEKKANNVLVKFVPKIVQNLQEYKKVYDKAEKKYGVNREIIAAILLKETKLGKIKPTHDAFIVFNTMVVRTDPKTAREKWILKMGKTNMASIITHCYKKGVEPEQCNLPSSYAGAVGIAQFMPNSFIYAESYNEIKTKVVKDLKSFDSIGLRDFTSCEILKSNNELKDKVYFSGDPSIILSEKYQISWKPKGKRIAIIPTERYKKSLYCDSGILFTNIIEKTKNQLRDKIIEEEPEEIICIPFGQDDNNDLKTCKKLENFLGKIKIVDLQSPLDALKILSECSKVYTYRLHGLLLSYSLGVPCECFYYHRKTKRVEDTLKMISKDKLISILKENIRCRMLPLL